MVIPWQLVLKRSGEPKPAKSARKDTSTPFERTLPCCLTFPRAVYAKTFSSSSTRDRFSKSAFRPKDYWCIPAQRALATRVCVCVYVCVCVCVCVCACVRVCVCVIRIRDPESESRIRDPETGIRKLDWMSRHEACGAARLSVHFLMFGFSTPAHAQMRLAAQQPRSSAATSSTNVVNTTSEFETWRWHLSRLSSLQRPAALAHQPRSHSSASPRALRQNSPCHTPLSWGGCGAALAFRSFAPP